MDPFGLKGCGFDQLEPFLTRDPAYSTDIVLTMCMPVVHRLAGRRAVEREQVSDIVKSYHRSLSAVFGGDYWKDILLDQPNVDAETKEFQLIEAYLTKLKQYLPYAGYCPVRRNSDGRIKYFMVFVSRHPDAMLLMNNIMYKAYFSRMHEADYKGSLFEEMDWRDMPLPEERSIRKLNETIKDLVSLYPGESRDFIWLKIVQTNFMRYDQGLYLAALKQISSEKELIYLVDPQTKRHNHNSKIYPVE